MPILRVSILCALAAAFAFAADEPVFDGKGANEWAQQLKDKDPELRKQAAAALAEIGSRSTKSIPALQAALKDGDEGVREAAQDALERVWGADVWRGRREDKEKLLSKGGGGKATKDAVAAALGWLARHQEEDGHWSGSAFDQRCEKEACAGTGLSDYPVGLTGLALLAFLGDGCGPDSETVSPDGLPLGPVVKKGIDWLLKRQGADGCFGAAGTKMIYEHAVACEAVSEAYGLTRDEALKAPAQKGVDFLVGAQNAGKGWRYAPRCGDNDTSATGWCVLALKSAKAAGLRVPRSAFEGAFDWVFSAMQESGGRIGYMSKMDAGVKVCVPGKNDQFAVHDTMTAIGMLIVMQVARDPADKGILVMEKFMQADLPVWDKAKGTNDYYYWYYATYAMFQASTLKDGAAPWKAWNVAMTAALVQHQETAKDSCARGSWDADDRWGFEAGRVCSTALNALTLEVYYRYPSVFTIGPAVDLKVSSPSVMRAREDAAAALRQQARDKEEKGDKAGALAIWRQIAKDFSDSKCAKEAAARIKALGGK